MPSLLTMSKWALSTTRKRAVASLNSSLPGFLIKDMNAVAFVITGVKIRSNQTMKRMAIRYAADNV